MRLPARQPSLRLAVRGASGISIRGGFDSSHLQEIHRYLYQDVSIGLASCDASRKETRRILS